MVLKYLMMNDTGQLHPFAKNLDKEAWWISMSYGEAEPYKKSRDDRVRCVRG